MKKLNRNDLKKLQGGSPPEDPIGAWGSCSASSCSTGYYPCCNANLCGCIRNDISMNCKEGGKSATECSVSW